LNRISEGAYITAVNGYGRRALRGVIVKAMARLLAALAGVCLASTALAACGLALTGSGAGGGDDGGTPGPDVGAQMETGGGDRAPNPPDAVVPNDAAADVTVIDAVTDSPPPPPDTGSDAGFDAGFDSGFDAGFDAADAGVLYSCPGGNPTTDCSTCFNHPLSCIMCSTTDTSISAVCVPVGSSCHDSYTPTGYDYCPCSYPSAALCLLPQQECNSYGGGVCVTCGEYSTDTFQCKGGGTCHESQSACY
jgi:hypothetical protein